MRLPSNRPPAFAMSGEMMSAAWVSIRVAEAKSGVEVLAGADRGTRGFCYPFHRRYIFGRDGILQPEQIKIFKRMCRLLGYQLERKTSEHLSQDRY